MSREASPTCPEMTKDLIKAEMSGTEDADPTVEAVEAGKQSPVRC